VSAATAPRVVLVGGHESDGGTDLVPLEHVVPRSTIVPAGRRLHDVVGAALDAGDTVVVVPMTFGRDPAMVADAARTLRWLATTRRGALALAAPFGVPDHLIARLRGVARAVIDRDPGAAIVVAARASNPFDDAELRRIAHLVAVHGAGAEVLAATVATDAELADAVGRLRRLGFPRVVVVPAGFARTFDVERASPAFAGTTFHGALLGAASVARIVAERVAAAVHDLDHGWDGIDDGLAADHAHGYAHSHPHDHADGHVHGAPHPHPHDQPVAARP